MSLRKVYVDGRRALVGNLGGSLRKLDCLEEMIQS